MTITLKLRGIAENNLESLFMCILVEWVWISLHGLNEWLLSFLWSHIWDWSMGDFDTMYEKPWKINTPHIIINYPNIPFGFLCSIFHAMYTKQYWWWQYNQHSLSPYFKIFFPQSIISLGLRVVSWSTFFFVGQ